MRASNPTLNTYQRALRGLSIPAALDAAARTYGQQQAIVHVENETPPITWAELRDKVSRVRTGLQQAGVQSGDRVGIQLRNHVEFPLSWLAVVELGAIAVPINPSYTPRERAFVLQDSAARWLIAAADLIDASGKSEAIGPVQRTNVITVNGEEANTQISFEDLLDTRPEELSVYPDQDTIANIQFTSGTTGLPKGCLLSHRYWIEIGVWQAALFEAKRILADYPFHYMQNQAYFWSALGSGGAIYVTAGRSRRKYLAWLADNEIDFAWVKTEMVDYVSPTTTPLALKRAAIATESPDRIRELEETFGIVARNCYASTEVGFGAFVPWDRQDLAMKGSMGFCFPNREAKIINEDRKELPRGQTGELCLRGEGMTQGYHNRPEANRELFLDGGWFRTGDLARQDEEGALYYEGRMKDMVRRSGENISCAEVELHLLSMPEVARVAVIPVPDASRGEEVKAIVVLTADGNATPAEILAHARSGLAPFKVPRYLEMRKELPLTASGKVQKATLRAEDPWSAATLDLSSAQGCDH